MTAHAFIGRLYVIRTPAAASCIGAARFPATSDRSKYSGEDFMNHSIDTDKDTQGKSLKWLFGRVSPIADAEHDAVSFTRRRVGISCVPALVA